MGQSRRQKRREFEKQLYLAASYFKMSSFSNGTEAKDGTVLDSSRLDSSVNRTVRRSHGLPPMPHPSADQRPIPDREVFPKFGKIARGEAVTRINAENDERGRCLKTEQPPSSLYESMDSRDGKSEPS